MGAAIPLMVRTFFRSPLSILAGSFDVVDDRYVESDFLRFHFKAEVFDSRANEVPETLPAEGTLRGGLKGEAVWIKREIEVARDACVVYHRGMPDLRQVVNQPKHAHVLEDDLTPAARADQAFSTVFRGFQIRRLFSYD